MSEQQDTLKRGEGLSSLLTQDTSKVNPVLWFFLLFLNALYTVIGIRLRDLRPNGACELNINRTIGIVEHFDRVGLFWGLWSIYPIVSIAIVLVQIVFHVLYCYVDSKTAQRPQQEGQGDQEQQGRGVKNVVEIIHIVLVNSLVIISGSLYIAADNFFFLVDPDHETHNPSTTRSLIAGSSFICSVLVLVVTQFFEHSVDKCLKTIKCVKGTNDETDKNEDEEKIAKKCLKILYFWWPFAGLITMFDSLFISVVDEISGEDSVRSGFDCSNERGFEGAIILYIAICIVFSISIGVIVAFKMIIKRKHIGKYSSFEWKWCCVHFLYIVYFLGMGIVFVITGLMFIAADNNWPWICLAKRDSNICSWVIVRVGILAAVTVFSTLLLLSSAALSILGYCEELYGKLKPAETANECNNANESAIDRRDVADEQTNTAASGTEIQVPNTTTEDIVMDDKLTVNPVNESGTSPEADSEF